MIGRRKRAKHINSANRRAAVLPLLTLAVTLLLTSCAPGSGCAGKNGQSASNSNAWHGGVELYQLAPDPNSLMMSYVIVTPNRKVVVIDGGIDGQGMYEPPYLPAAIRAILGLGQDEYFEVEAWFLSHGHWDHFYELAKMLDGYRAEDNYRINNFYFDFPDYGVEWTTANTSDYNIKELNVLKRGLDNYYAVNGFTGIAGAQLPEERWTKPADCEGESYYYDLINAAVINKASVKAGLTLDIDGVAFQVLCTWAKSSANVNSTTVVLRMVYGAHSVLFLGDAYVDTGNALLRNYSDDELRSEYVQMAHHGQSGTDQKFYTRIGAADSKRLWPSPVWVWEVYNATNGIRTDVTRSWLGLPADYSEFAARGLLDAGNDFVAGLYKAYPAKPDRADNWTADVLAAQRVAVFEKQE